MTSEVNIQTVQAQPKAEAASSKMSEAELQKLKKACADFESLFIYQLLKTMRQTVPKSQTGFGSFAKDTYTMMMDQKLAEKIAAEGEGVGLQKVLYDQLTRAYKQTTTKEVMNTLK